MAEIAIKQTKINEKVYQIAQAEKVAATEIRDGLQQSFVPGDSSGFLLCR